MPNHLQPGWDFIQNVGDIFAKLGKMRAAAARANITSGVNDLLARQMRGQRSAHWLESCGAGPVGGDGRLGGSLGFFEVFQLQFQLMDLGIEHLGRLAELHPAQLVELSFVLLDEEMSTGQFGARRSKFGLAFSEFGTQAGDLRSGVHRRRFYQNSLFKSRYFINVGTIICLI
jgi:hypothetical protein